ncbi:MAG: 16S rRNA (guanine(966)-N(2))-methyltransferase RsmD [Epsilonproteobacteria bacterium]|nr:16S rRNA (guanine(966)-N(2))-methyltransferase RsmD [Campylobacterota bacterium]
MADFQLTITGGKYKGKKLSSAALETTRSTKAILKGSLFDTLQFEIIDQSFVEVFGGSGSMGLEALSRGAKDAYFIEKDRNAYKVLSENCRLIDSSNTHTFFGDSFELYSKVVQTLLDQNQKAYLYFDPPFDIREGMEDIYERVLALIADTPSEVVLLIVVEHATKTKMPDTIGIYQKIKSKKFGKSSLTYYALA